MAEQTVLGGIITFLGRLGFFDVILPFLLIFTLIYAILDKTMILGKEPGVEGTHPRRNLNSIVAFASGLMFVAAKKLVAIVNQAVANIGLLVVLGVFFMMLLGMFIKDGEFDFSQKHKFWFKFLTGFMAVGTFLIFLHALGWDQTIIDFFIVGSDMSDAISAILFLGFVALFIWFVSFPASETNEEDENDAEGEGGNNQGGG